MKLTQFQKDQIIAIKLQGHLAYRNLSGNRWPMAAWRKMIQVLVSNDLVCDNFQLTAKGLSMADQIHAENIS